MKKGLYTIFYLFLTIVVSQILVTWLKTFIDSFWLVTIIEILLIASIISVFQNKKTKAFFKIH